jgi:phospholipase C
MPNEPIKTDIGPLAAEHVPVNIELPLQPLDPLPPPRFATFTMDNFGISNTRSRHNDTDFVHLGANVGANPIVFASRPMGDVNNGTHSVGLSLEVDIPDDDTIVVFTYMIRNGQGNDATNKVVQSALNAIGEEIIKHGDIAAAVTVGSLLVPVVGSLLAAVAGILGAVEGGLVLFADCDGVVAAGSMRFTCSDLIKRTATGQKITQSENHAGTDSPTGCGSNSQYSTACNVTTAPSTQTVLDLRGAWASGGVAGPIVSMAGNSISIDMSSSHRPQASGSVLDSTKISVNFPDDKTYTGVLQAPNLIKWSNDSSWTKVPAIETVIDLNGPWMVGGVLGPVITVHGNALSIAMPANRPTATGSIVNGSDISVRFPDDTTYTGVLQKPNTIRWSNNATWTKFGTSVIKHLFVLMMENRSFDHLLGFQGIVGKDAQTGAATKAEDFAEPKVVTIQQPSNGFDNLRYTVSPTAGDKTFNTHDVKHQFPDVLMQLCGQTAGQANNKGLKGAAYPPVAKLEDRGFAADYALNSDATNPGEPMRCFAAGTLPVLTALAKEFVLCDHWYSSIPGPTEPNRMFAHAASSGGWDDSPTTSQYEDIYAKNVGSGVIGLGGAGEGISFANGTIFDALRRANVPFRIYTGDAFPQVGLLSGISLLSDIDDFENFAGDLNDPSFDAAYTFIEPRYDQIPQSQGLSFVNNSQHPPNSIEQGEALIKTVYEAIRNSLIWNQSMLIVTYDEHGGFFDHVTPPPAKRIPAGSPSKDIEGISYGFMFDQYGLRVPAIVISPWCPQNLIDHRQFEHSSIPGTIEQLFNLGPLTVRDTDALSVHTLASLSAPRNVTATIPNPITVGEPSGPVQGTPAGSGGPTVISGASTPVAAPAAAGLLDLNDPWLSSALAVAVKAHMEATPADAANIKARGFGVKTVADLAQYYNEMAPVVQNARVLARQKKVAVRRLAVSQAGKFIAKPAVKDLVTG